MFEPDQVSNQFSNYNNAAMPWPPSYNPGLQGGPVNAATGQPIQSYQNWAQANPGGMSINNTPAAPQAAPQASPQAPIRMATMPDGMPAGQTSLGRGVIGQSWQRPQQPAQSQAGPAPSAAPQQSGPPNNWMPALNALANPGNPTTQGATVPQVTGYQPSGGVNNAFLQQAQGQPGMNQNFLSALSAIQGRKQ
jgi:hypothetical protein